MLILTTKTAWYSIGADNSLTPLVTGLTEDEIWDVADFGSYILGTNGTIMVKYESSTWSSFASSTHIPRMSTLCNFKGQAVGGNIQTTWSGCNGNSLIWSEIGSIKFTPTKLNTAGFRNIDWPGDVLRVKRLGDIVMVYGEEGIGSLFPVSEPAPTFGLKKLQGVGIPVKGAVGGDIHIHTFVDEEGYLWLVQEGKAPERLGYKEFFSALTAANLMIAYDPSEKEFYISDGTTSYLLTQWGLCENYQSVTSIARRGNASIGPLSDGSDTTFTLTTDIMDFGVRGFKTLGTVELGVDTGEVDQAVQVRLHHRADKKSAFSQSSWINTNKSGVAVPMKTAEEFKISVKAAAYGGMKLDYINARVKLSDRRFVRGLYAMQKYAESQKG